jgi:hypothetical protein
MRRFVSRTSSTACVNDSTVFGIGVASQRLFFVVSSSPDANDGLKESPRRRMAALNDEDVVRMATFENGGGED